MLSACLKVCAIAVQLEVGQGSIVATAFSLLVAQPCTMLLPHLVTFCALPSKVDLAAIAEDTGLEYGPANELLWRHWRPMQVSQVQTQGSDVTQDSYATPVSWCPTGVRCNTRFLCDTKPLRDTRFLHGMRYICETRCLSDTRCLFSIKSLFDARF